MDILIAHLIGDYILQNDWMAENKKKSNKACFIHCLLYIIPFCFFLNWWQIILIFIQHYIQDRTNFVKWFMDFKGSKDFRLKYDWSSILVDNIIHLLFIYLIT